MSWEEARIYCTNLESGVSLAEIHNENTQNLIIKKAEELGIANMENSGWWLGSNQINDAINWKWDYTGIKHTYDNFVSVCNVYSNRNNNNNNNNNNTTTRNTNQTNTNN